MSPAPTPDSKKLEEKALTENHWEIFPASTRHLSSASFLLCSSEHTALEWCAARATTRAASTVVASHPDQRCSRRQRASHHLTLSQVGFDWMPWISFERAASVGYHWDHWHINIYGEQF